MNAQIVLRSTILTVFLCCVGCSSTVKVRDISRVLDPDEKFGGLAFRIPAMQELKVYMKQMDGTYRLVHQTLEEMPDQSKRYALDVKSGTFSDHTLIAELHAEDSTLTKVDLTTTLKAAETIGEITTQTTAVAEAVATYEQTRMQAELDARKKQIDLEASRAAIDTARHAKIVAAKEALVAVIKAQAEFDNLPSDTPPVTLAQKAADLGLLKIKANHAFLAAGLAEPFPEENLP